MGVKNIQAAAYNGKRTVCGFMVNFHKNSWTVSNQGPETVVANLLYDEKNDKLTSCEASLLDGEGTETKIDTQRAEVRFYNIKNCLS